MAGYSKFIAALVGIGLLWLKQNTDIDFGDDAVQKLTDLIVMIGTPIMVYAFKNK